MPVRSCSFDDCLKREEARHSALHKQTKVERLKIVSGVAGENENNKKRQTPY